MASRPSDHMACRWSVEPGLDDLGEAGLEPAGRRHVVRASQGVELARDEALSHLGVRHIDMPTTPMRVFRAIQQARQGGN